MFVSYCIPGFDHDPEVKHVEEISHKLAHFVIDTDTNSSIQTESDNGDSTETESTVDRLADQITSRVRLEFTYLFSVN